VIDVGIYLEEKIDVASARHRSDIFQMIGMYIEEGKKPSPWQGYRSRMPWIFCNMFGGFACAVISRVFELVLAKVLLPKLIKLKYVKEHDLESQQRKLYKIVTMFSYLFLFLILILDEKIITIIYGDEFNKFPYLISILAPIAIFVSWGTVAATINIVNSERKNHMLRNITGFTANAFFGLLLIPYYGIYGAAISSIIGFFFLSFGYSFLSKNGDWRFMLNSLILKN